MADKGIIFSAPMVRALLAGRKTQTRRIITKKPALEALAVFKPGFLLLPGNADLLPYATGDRLYVREACRAEELHRPTVIRKATRKERALLKRTEVTVADELDGQDGVRYLADDDWLPIENSQIAGDRWGVLFHYGKGPAARMKGLGKGVPSIHMPRWASRLWLAVTDVRVQRVQDISEADAQAEGVERLVTDGGAFYAGFPEGTYRCGFAGIWSHLHTAEGEHWDDNPWIVAVTFDVHQGNIDKKEPEQ